MKNILSMVFSMAALLLMSSVAVAAHHAGGETKTCDYSSTYKAGPYFVSPKDGETVSGKVKVKMGMKGMQVHKAGELIDGTGHHHLIIDGAYVPETEAVPKDAQHIHFGKGQTETEITLTPGEHTLTLQFADGHHQSYGKVFSHTIRVMVK